MISDINMLKIYISIYMMYDSRCIKDDDSCEVSELTDIT